MVDIITFLQNKILNAIGVERSLLELINAKDINKAMQLFQNRDDEVEEAIKQYNPETHVVMNRGYKARKSQNPYVYETLPRAWQRYINEIALFFLLAKPIAWKEINGTPETEVAFKAYEDFLKETRFNSNMRIAKRVAGSETECAKVYHMYDDDGEPKVKVIIIRKSEGYTIRPLFDQYRNMKAFAYGYKLRENGKNVEHFDILMPDYNYYCTRRGVGWEVEARANPIGKIAAIYYRQPVEWEGVQIRIERDEMLDSKSADVNNYFADPILKVSASILESVPKPETIGKLVEMNDKDDVFEYVEPPHSLELKDSEKEILRKSILNDSFTPDFSFENLKGSGTLSGDALKRAENPGYMKADNRKEIYDELIDREKNIILAIMANVTHIPLRNAISKLNIEHEFSEPFDQDSEKTWQAIGRAYTDGIVSLKTAVNQIGLANPIEEVKEIQNEKQIKDEHEFYPAG